VRGLAAITPHASSRRMKHRQTNPLPIPAPHTTHVSASLASGQVRISGVRTQRQQRRHIGHAVHQAPHGLEGLLLAGEVEGGLGTHLTGGLIDDRLGPAGLEQADGGGGGGGGEGLLSQLVGGDDCCVGSAWRLWGGCSRALSGGGTVF